MKIIVCLLLAQLFFSNAKADDCERLARASALLADEEFKVLEEEEFKVLDEEEFKVIEEIVEQAEQEAKVLEALDALAGLQIPEIYKKHEQAFLEAIMKPAEKLSLLAMRYDQAATKEEKAKILAELMEMFSISIENQYMLLIARGQLSKEFKLALYYALSKKFNNDPSWQPYLEEAMKTGGLR